MKRLTLTLAAALAAPLAVAYDSRCYVYTDTSLEPSAYATLTGTTCTPGTQSARNRWIGPSDEHRQLMDTSATQGGLGDEAKRTFLLRVFTLAGGSEGTYTPSAFASAERARSRYMSFAEFAQLPDHSYGLWDWATGHETCPLSSLVTDPADCHVYESHLGIFNSSHFLPQAATWYRHYHTLALARAGACRDMNTRTESSGARFDLYRAECEQEALVLESIGQHYLEDAWSSGHMWERWGSTEPAEFPGADDTQRHQRAIMIALTTGILHGARAGVEGPGFIPWASRTLILGARETNDALCGPVVPSDYVASVDDVDFLRTLPPPSFWDPTSLSRHLAVGDLYLDRLSAGTWRVQRDRLHGCGAGSVRAVYDAARTTTRAQALGAPGTATGTLDPAGADATTCLGQRMVNSAMYVGMGLDYIHTSGQQRRLALTSSLVTGVIPIQVRLTTGSGVTAEDQAQYRLDLSYLVGFGRAYAAVFPDDTHGAAMRDIVGDPVTILGVEPNSSYNRLGSNADPDFPAGWALSSSTDTDRRRAAIARTFHRSHAADWCRFTTPSDLNALRSRARDTSLDADTHAAACEACAEFAVRHLRVGADASTYDRSAEPLCHHLLSGTSTTPAYIYERARGNDIPPTTARVWCGCDEALVLTPDGLGRVVLSGATVTRGTFGAGAATVLALGNRPRAFAVTTYNGARAVVSNFLGDSVSLVSLDRGRERELDTDGDASNGLTRIATPTSASPNGVAVSADGRYALVALSGTDEVGVIDLANTRLGLCKRFRIPREPGSARPTAPTVPSAIVVTRDGLKGYVSLAGSPSQPGHALAVLDMARAASCTVSGGEVRSYMSDLGGDPRPLAMALSPDGTRLAVAGVGNDRVMIVDVATDTIVDLYPTDPSRRFFDTALDPMALAWQSDGAQLFIGSTGGLTSGRLSGYGAVRIGVLATGFTTYDVGVRGAVRSMVLSSDDRYLYVGDSAGNITALSVDLWDGSALHILPPFDGTGGCLSFSGRAQPCTPALSVGSELRQLSRF